MRAASHAHIADAVAVGAGAARYDPFADLNDEQRSAVEHGLVDVPPKLAPLFEAVMGTVAPAGSAEPLPPIPRPGFDTGARARSPWK